MRTTVVAIATALAWTGCTCSSEVTITPPRVNQGGRAVAVSVAQTDQKRLLVASESGGLFRSFDGGVSFQHLDAFPTFAPVDVSIASLDANTMLATARDDFRAVSGGGIWRSTDGGATWKRPGGWPPMGVPCSSFRPSASGISHMPLTRTFHVATDCGLATSTDNGATFTFAALDPLNPSLFAVLITGRSTGVAADSRRTWFLQNGQWLPALGGPDAGGTFTPHAFAAPFWADPNIFYHAGRDELLWVSTTAGGAWRLMNIPDHGQNREPFVRVGRGLDGDATHLDVYYGNGFALLRQAVTTAVPGGSNTWKEPDHTDHRDPSDLAFTPGFTQPLVLTSDGGVHLTEDNGTNWHLTGSNFGGFTALQIGEVTGRKVEGGAPHQDLVYATQDNDIKGSHDGGQTWDGSICCEGAFVRADAANPAHVETPVSGKKCSNCGNFLVPPHIGQQASAPAFPNAPLGGATGPVGPPFQLVDATYLQDVANMGAMPPTFDYFLTGDRGTSWAPAFSLPRQRVGIAHFAGNLDNPVTYVGVAGAFSGTAGLMRVSGVSGAVTVQRADSAGIFGFGVLPTAQASYAVFGVDPANADHLIGVDVVLQQAVASVNGGQSWFNLPALTTAATDTGKFFLARSMKPFITTIAFDPTNSCHILVGTMQNGVIRSADGGLTWRRVAGSPVATWITSFYFPPSGSIWMSSYGRGLWRLSVNRAKPASGRCQFPRPLPPGAVIPDSLIVLTVSGASPRRFTGLTDAIMCQTCSLVSVEGGWITSVTGTDAISALSISSGVVSQHAPDGRELPLMVPNTYVPDESPEFIRRAGGELLRTAKVRGVVLNGTQLVGFVLGRGESIVPAARRATIYLRDVPASGATAPDSLDVSGYGFVQGARGTGVSLVFGADTVAREIAVRGDGRFVSRVAVRRPKGPLLVRAVQRDGRRLTMIEAEHQVPGRDGR